MITWNTIEERIEWTIMMRNWIEMIRRDREEVVWYRNAIRTGFYEPNIRNGLVKHVANIEEHIEFLCDKYVDKWDELSKEQREYFMDAPYELWPFWR